ncbi:MAG: bacteriohemerythrin [Candidatus Krumholzibacteriia bacterium]
MAQIEWTPAMSVGHAGIDRQHQTLLDIYNRFDAAASQGKGRREVEGIVAELCRYTAIHFATEEQVLAEHGYPDLARHQVLHRQLIAKLDEFQADLARGARVTSVLRQFLGYWWQNHILEHDREFGAAIFGVGQVSPVSPD